MEPFTDNQKAILSTMIQEAVKASFNIDLRDFLKSTLDEIVKSTSSTTKPTTTVNPPPMPTKQLQQKQRQQYARQPQRPAINLQPKQQLWLMHSYERILMKSYEMQKYTAYIHFISTRQPKEMSGITYRYLSNTTKKTPTNEEISKTANQLAAINEHIATEKAYITEQKTAIKQLFITLDCNNTNIYEH